VNQLIHSHRLQAFLTAIILVGAAIRLDADQSPVTDRFANHEKIVAQTQAASLKLRESSLRKTIAKNTSWPSGTWGDNLWCLAALYLNQKTDEANTRLLKSASALIASTPEKLAETTPENPGKLPWSFFSITDYLRILYLFHANSPHFPGRLKPETEAAMKESLWLWVRGESRLDQVGPKDQFLLLGTENHDLNRRPPYYLITAFLNADPAYRDRKLDDGHSVAEHAAAYTAYFREWPRSRAKSGLWVEVGSNGYQKYSWPALFNLHELSPDPVIRHRFGLLLDIAFIEEAQISVRGVRGGGRSRAYGGANGFENYKNLLFAREGKPAGSTHSRVIETSRYQIPASAILLDKIAFPAVQLFAIRNRVLGEVITAGADGGPQVIASDSSLLNYAWRTPHYLLGSTLQNPTLSYAGISRQNRCCGLLFDDPTYAKVGTIDTLIEKTGKGRPQHSFWSIQHENVLILQRIAAKKVGGSYNTGEISIHFDVPGLEIIDEDGWIFASNGKAFVGVKFLDGGHRWNDSHTIASPAHFKKAADTGRILLHAGDITAHESFARFRETLRACPLEVTADKVDYRFGDGKQRIEMFLYNVAASSTFNLPRINGLPIDLKPDAVYQSPFLNGVSDSDRITATVGPVRQVVDFASEGPAPVADTDKASFDQAAAGVWKNLFSDPCTGDWRQKWFLDGEVGTVVNAKDGMTLTAGPEFMNEAHHMVLWTKDSFQGDLRIDYDYTRTDNETRCVNILYIQATGSGAGSYDRDITKWNELRKVPSMETYFNHIHTYHLSYAAFPNSGENRVSYIRARRYLPEAKGLKGTEMVPDHDPQGLFAQGVPHQITVIKKNRELFMRVKNAERTEHFHFRNPQLPIITEGRIGLRHMFTRSARYANFRISIPQ
jgi:hypothetical protein